MGAKTNVLKVMEELEQLGALVSEDDQKKDDEPAASSGPRELSEAATGMMDALDALVESVHKARDAFATFATAMQEWSDAPDEQEVEEENA